MLRFNGQFAVAGNLIADRSLQPLQTQRKIAMVLAPKRRLDEGKTAFF